MVGGTTKKKRHALPMNCDGAVRTRNVRTGIGNSQEHKSQQMKLLFTVLAISMPVAAQQSYSPYVDRDYPDTVYWGDTHLHTYLSADAYSFGATITPDQAYRFAKGETTRATGGDDVRIRRPLDFLMVADHAENLGVLPAIVAGDPRILSTNEASQMAGVLARLPSLSEMLVAGTQDEFDAGAAAIGAAKAIAFSDFDLDETFKREVWEGVVAVAERHNDPGKFTAFAGYEYTSTPIHRNVLFVGGPGETLKTLPFSSVDSPDPEDLWTHLTRYKETTGSDVISIPHNSNLSRGNMFRTVTYDGKPITQAYARIRADIEPIIEVTQIKGDSETHPLISPVDEFADHETYGRQNTATDKSRTPEVTARASYARSALQTGLDIEASVGVNPYKFGMIGSTDAHTGLATVDEDNFWGKLGAAEPGIYRLATQSRWSSAGYAAVWATENTREAIFAAMKRREVYATTGPRITLRFFAGWDYAEGDAHRPDIAAVGYRLGVPMGGDLIQNKETSNKAPTFLIRATKDPDGANLDRVQVVKGWRNGSGNLQEKVYDVAWSGHRKMDSDGVLPTVGSTINLAEASYHNTIGSPELSANWSDPDFNKTERAVYYVRVLQIPTPRWTVYDAKFFRQEIPQDTTPVIQERAYSSPIWYTPL